MKKLLYLLLALTVTIGIASCTKEEEGPQKWEYKTLTVWGDTYSDFYMRSIDVPQAKMDTLGTQGWELVSVYTKTETVHPNFGNAQYVTGLQANTRTAAVCYVFKRPLIEDATKNEVDCDSTDAVAVEEVVVADSAAVD